MNKDATIRIGTEGAEEAARAADRVLRPWQSGMQSLVSGARSFGSAFADTVRQVGSDVARGVSGFAAFSLASQIPTVIQYREESARLSVVAGQSSEDLRRKFAAQEAAIASSRQENQRFAQSLGRLTYDYKGASDAAGALGTEALAANRSLGEMAGIGKVAREATGSFESLPEVLGRIRAQADALKTVGGPDALRDQIEQLGGAISKLSTRSPEDFGKITALAGGLGAGMRPEAQARAQQSLIGAIQANPMQWERYLQHTGGLAPGESILDENGHVRDVGGVLEKIRDRLVRRRGLKARRVAQALFGAEGGAALMNADFAAIRAAEGLAPSTGAADAAAGYLGSEEGQRQAAMLQMKGAQGEAAAKTLPAVDSVLGFAREHPLLAGAGALLGPALINKALGWGLGKAGGLLFGGAGAGAAAGGGGGAAAAAGGRGLLGMLLRATASGGGRAAALDAAAQGGWLSSTGLGGSAVTGAAAGGGLVLLSALLAGKGLSQLGEGSAVKQGFALTGLDPEQAMEAARKADAARAGAAGQRSTGMQSALEQERFRLARAAAMQAPEEERPLVAFKAARGLGASRDEAENIARVIDAKVSNPVITIVNMTGGPIEAVAEQGATDATGAQ